MILLLTGLDAEEWPDGTFGGTRIPTHPWTPEEQAAHRAELEAALHHPAA